MKTKSYCREQAKIIRKKLDIENISTNICEIVRNHSCYKSAQNVMIFYPLKYEINLLELLNDKKNFYLPKIDDNNEITVCPYSSDLKKSDLKIFEPCTNPVYPEILDLIFVPALMIDSENYRLGYGGGYYDRFLSKYPNIKTITPIAKELIVDKLPHESFDIKIDEIISSK